MPYLNCQHCGNKFYTRPWTIKQGFGKYCSKTCSNTHNNPSLSFRMSIEVEDAIAAAYLSGKSKREAGEMYGYGRGATAKILKSRNIQPRTISQANKGRVHSPETKSRIAENHANVSGKNNPMYGKEPGHGKWTYVSHLGKRVRSSWEATIASILYKMDIVHEYETRRIHLSEMTYLPDFYLPDFDKYIEVKGWENARFKRVLNALQSEQPVLCNRLIIINAEIYKLVCSNHNVLLELLKAA